MNTPGSTRLSQLINIGPRTERHLNAVNILTVQELRDVGAWEAWRRLKQAYPLITDDLTFYRLQGALLGVHWKELAGNPTVPKEQGE
jgi:DNA transformation protein